MDEGAPPSLLRLVLQSKPHVASLLNFAAWAVALIAARGPTPSGDAGATQHNAGDSQHEAGREASALALYSSALVLSIAIFLCCTAIAASSMRSSKRRTLATMSLCAVECALVAVLWLAKVNFLPQLPEAVDGSGSSLRSNTLLLAFSGAGYWCFIMPWRSDWAAYLSGKEEPGPVNIPRMLALANVSAALFLAPRLYPHPAVILACHIPMTLAQIATNAISFRVAYLGTTRSGQPFPILYGAASILGFTSGFCHVTEMAFLFGKAPFIAAETHLVFTVLARLLGCCCLMLHSMVRLDEQTRLKAELAAAREKAEAADAHEKERETFMRFVFHEVRVPLNSISLGLALALEEAADGSQPLPQETYEHLSLLRHSTDLVMSIISDSLDLQKMEAGAMQLALGAVDVRDLATNSVAQMWPFSNARKCGLSASVDSGVPRYFLGDAAKISQCLTNFLSNAIKFVEAGSGTVTLRVRMLDPQAVQEIREQQQGAIGKRVLGKAAGNSGALPVTPAGSSRAPTFSFLSGWVTQVTGAAPSAAAAPRSPQHRALAGGTTPAAAAEAEDKGRSRMLASLTPVLEDRLRASGYVVEAAATHSPVLSLGQGSSRAEGEGHFLSSLRRDPASSTGHRRASGSADVKPKRASLLLPSLAGLPSALPGTAVGSDRDSGQMDGAGRPEPMTAYVEFAVTDNGCGIEPHELALLYQPFVQVEAGVRQKGKGTGLGLSIVKHIIAAHGGTVHVASTPGVGSTFSFILPCLVLRSLKDENAGGRMQTVSDMQAGGDHGAPGLAALRRYLGEQSDTPSAAAASTVLDPASTASDGTGSAAAATGESEHDVGAWRRQPPLFGPPTSATELPRPQQARHGLPAGVYVTAASVRAPASPAPPAPPSQPSADSHTPHAPPVPASVHTNRPLTARAGGLGGGSAWESRVAFFSQSTSPTGGSGRTTTAQSVAEAGRLNTEVGDPDAGSGHSTRTGSVGSTQRMQGQVSADGRPASAASAATTAADGTVDHAPAALAGVAAGSALPAHGGGTASITRGSAGGDGDGIAGSPTGRSTRAGGATRADSSGDASTRYYDSVQVSVGEGAGVNAAAAPTISTGTGDAVVVAVAGVTPTASSASQQRYSISGQSVLAEGHSAGGHESMSASPAAVPLAAATPSAFKARTVQPPSVPSAGPPTPARGPSPPLATLPAPSGGAGVRTGDAGTPAPPSSAADSASAALPLPLPAGIPFTPLRFLFVDDVPSNRRFLARLLQRRYPSSTVFDECEDGEVALVMCARLPGAVNEDGHGGRRGSAESSSSSTGGRSPASATPMSGRGWAVSSWPYDVVCMDGSMPVMDGYAATRALRAAGYPGLILGVTGNALEADRRAFLEAGANAIVAKPVQPEQIVGLVLQRFGKLAEASMAKRAGAVPGGQ